ncbi:MAG: DUF1223 domain-containing protein [Chitinophagales bacterium]|nr:DUF1223 domain-containing protein [Chitinophagales bacterium]
MKASFISILSLTVVLLFSGSSLPSSFEPIAVIELFTSQGCSSCPPADELLSATISDAQKDGRKIFALEFHVDYWNRLGWADPFSDKSFSERQSTYSRFMHLQNIYTPQMVVNGTHEFVGSDDDRLGVSLAEAMKVNAAAAFKRLNAARNGNQIEVQYELDGDYTNCKINVALVSLKESTPVKRGENGGRTLHNANVVRQFTSMKAENTGIIHLTGSLPEDANTSIIAFVQNNTDMKITGAASAVFAKSE